MADAVPPTSPTPVIARPSDNLGGSTINVGSGAGDLQTAINASVQGDTLVVPAGVTYNPITLPLRTGSGWTCIRSGSASLPAAGTRVSSANTAAMFKVVGDGNPDSSRALRMTANTQGWRIIGGEFTHPNSNFATGTMDLYNCSRVSLERCYVHGLTTQDCNRPLYVRDSNNIQLWDSWFSEGHALNNADTNAIYLNGVVVAHIENCQLEGAGENMMHSDQFSAPVFDVTFLRNTLFKPLAWFPTLADGSANGAYGGINWPKKNLYEIKWASRLKVEGCIFENLWGGVQDDTAILLNGGKAPVGDCRTTDLLFQHNEIRTARHGVTVNVSAGLGGMTGGLPNERCWFRNNLFLNVRGHWIFLSHYSSDIAFLHNTAVPVGSAGSIQGSIWIDNDTAGSSWPRLTLKDNVFGKSTFSVSIALLGSLQTTSNATLDQYFPDRSMLGNAEFNNSGTMPTGFTPYATAALAGVNTSNGVLISGSPLIGTASDGGDVGVNFTTLAAARTGTATGDTTAPSVPTNLAVSGSPLTTSYVLTWTASPESDTGGYEIEVTDTTTSAVRVLSATASPLTVSGLAASRQYANRIRAFDTPAGNRSAYSSVVNVTTAAAPSAGTPPSTMRGFGSIRGLGATDKITTPLTAQSAQRTRMLWYTHNGIGTGDQNTHVFSKESAERLYVDGNGTTLVYQHFFSTTAGAWRFPIPTTGARACLTIRYDNGATTNDPVIKVDDVVQSLTEISAPVGTATTNANAYVLGNNAAGTRTLDGDLGKFAIYNFLSTDANDTAFFGGTDPLTIGAGPSYYAKCDGTTNEPDASTAALGNATIVGTKAQTYTAGATTITSLTVTSGDPATGGNYQVTAATSGTVNRVEFRVDGTLTRTDSAAPYTLFASDSTLASPGIHAIEARVYADAGATPSDTTSIQVTEGTAAATNTWTATYTWERDPNASGGYKVYVDGALSTTVAQVSVGVLPSVTLTFTGADTTKAIGVSCVYAGAVEGPRTTLSKRYLATATSGVKAPTGLQEVFRSYAP